MLINFLFDFMIKQISRAASLVYASLKFASMLKNETLPPDYMRGTPLCMDQFKALFGSCRIPMENTRDHVENYPESSHIVVFHRCQVYYFQVSISRLAFESGVVTQEVTTRFKDFAATSDTYPSNNI